MADDKVRYEVVVPSEILLSEEADMVVIPGGEGDFGVLPGHAPLLSTLRPGVLEVYDGNAVTRRLFVAGGLAEVTPDGCTVLAEEAIPVEEIDREEARQRAEEARQAYEAAQEEGRPTAEKVLRAAEAYLVAAENVRGKA